MADKLPAELKQKALQTLAACGSVTQTCEKHKIHRNTLLKWQRQAGIVHKAKKRMGPKRQNKATTALEQRLEDAKKISNEDLKQAIKEQIYAVLPFTYKLDELQKALKTMYEIDDGAPPAKSLTLIQSLTQKFMNYENPDTVDGDTEEST